MAQKPSNQVTSRFLNVFDNHANPKTGSSWTHIKEISNTNLIVTLNHNAEKSVSMEVLDTSNKREAKKIYSLEEVSGGEF